ncbi:MAG: glycosyltransferase family 39 protein [Bacteroidota bacterium]
MPENSSTNITQDLKKIAFWGILSASVVYVVGWFINVMDPDSAQYASITREMLERGDFLTFTDQGREYLDKPPLLFWLSGISFKIFGINNVAFRIPAFLATLLALYSTFKLTTLYYDKKTGYLAALILATLQATFLINHDVRTDTNLICWFVFSMWQVAAYLENKKPLHFILAFIGIGLAMLAKGPIGLVAPGLGIFMHLILRKEWKTLFNPVWMFGLLILALVLLPMSYGLYTQFDQHPEKIVNGLTGVSGLRFYYWTQSFGRITGENAWNNNAGPFFLLHSTLWAFFPWSIFLALGLIKEAKNIFQQLTGKPKQKEFLVFFGFLLPFMALSASAYQLPHYAFIVFPLGAIITSKYILEVIYESGLSYARLLYIIQTIVLFILLIVVFALVWFCFPKQNLVAIIIYVTLVTAFLGLTFFVRTRHKLILVCTISAIGINLILNTYFYPELLKYQAGSEMATKALENGLTKGNFYCFKAGQPWAMNFYTDMTIPATDDFENLIVKRNILIFTREEFLEEFRSRRPDLQVIHCMGEYPVSTPRMKFLNPATREETLKRKCLIKL